MTALLGHLDLMPFIYLAAMAYAFLHMGLLLINMHIEKLLVEGTLLYLAFTMHGGHVSTGIAVMLMPVIVTHILFRRKS